MLCDKDAATRLSNTVPLLFYFISVLRDINYDFVRSTRETILIVCIKGDKSF